MKTKIHLLTIALLAITVMTETFAQADKKIKIYLDLEKNGEKIKIDTSFSSVEKMKEFMNLRGLENPGVFEFDGSEDLNEFEYEFKFDDSGLSPEKEAEIKKALEKAKVELKKAEAEISISKKEFRNVNAEMENAKELYSKIIVDIGDLDSPDHKKMLKRLYRDFDDGESKVIIIEGKDVADDAKEMMFVKIYCDSISTDDAKVKIIRKVKTANPDTNEQQFKKNENTNHDTEVEMPEVNPSLTPKTDEDYRLKVSDFKLYPNPTHGKINLSFTVETPGKIQIRLLDAVGRVLVDEEVSNHDGTFSKEYFIDGNSRGTYLLQLKQGEKWRHEKIVVK